MTNKTYIFVAVLQACLVLPSGVRAQTWSTIGSSCEPGSDSIGLYSYDGGTFQFASGATGRIRARCQVNNPLDSGVPQWDTLTVGYVDPDNLIPGYEVKVELARAYKWDGSYTTLATFDSNAFTDSGPTSNHITFTHTFDFSNYAYYVTLVVNRPDSNGNPGVWFASLQ